MVGLLGWRSLRSETTEVVPIAKTVAPKKTVAPTPSPAPDAPPAAPRVAPPAPTAAPSAAPSSAPAASAATSADADAAKDNLAYLTVTCKPACLVFLDGRRVGVSPVKKKVFGAGPHKLVAYRDDVGSKTFDIELVPGEHVVQDVNMYGK